MSLLRIYCPLHDPPLHCQWALIDSGRVLGVINMVLVKNSKESVLSSPSGISYAIPVRFVRALLAGG